MTNTAAEVRKEVTVTYFCCSSKRCRVTEAYYISHCDQVTNHVPRSNTHKTTTRTIAQ